MNETVDHEDSLSGRRRTGAGRPAFRLGRELLGLVVLMPALVLADSVAPRAEDNTVAAQLASFELADGYAINLFASEEDGVANPITMRWDSRGRLWVLCSLVYPQILPAQDPNDKLYILTDTDHDGRSDRSVVFADGLNMPTGFALGDGGVYVGEGRDLIFLVDTDGDDRADERRLVLTGFGTGDTHQNINSFTWSPGGELFFCQGLHGFGRVETPWGIQRLDQHGVWRLRPRRLQLHAFRGGSSQNPWGIAHGPWGKPFVKGGSGTALSELLPIMVPTDHFHPPVDIGATRIKSMIVELVDSPALPQGLQGDALIAGYFAHTIDRMQLVPDGAGHRAEPLPPLLRSSHRSFRPVDLQVGPDGALYIADWFNPIIGHYQASLRHPDRDKSHGRIWRVSAPALAPVPPLDLSRLSTPQLLRHLTTAPLHERERVRIELSHRQDGAVLEAVDAWLEEGEADSRHQLRQQFEALCLLQWRESVNSNLLHRLLRSDHPLARAYATRVAGRWQDRLPDPLALLRASIGDPHPRVRLEAIVACSYIPSAGAMRVAARALDRTVDRFHRAALIQVTHALEPHWSPALLGGQLVFDRPEHLAFVLNQSSSGQLLPHLRQLLQSQSLPSATAASLTALLALHGDPSDLAWAFEHGSTVPSVLDALAQTATLRNERPQGDLESPLRELLREGSPEQQRASLRAAAAWRLSGLGELASALATNSVQAPAVQIAALHALPALLSERAWPLLEQIASRHYEAPMVRQAALQAAAEIDLDRAARLAARLFRDSVGPKELPGWVLPFARHRDGPEALARALRGDPLPRSMAVGIRAAMGTAGRHSKLLDQVLQQGSVLRQVGTPEYSEPYVAGLADLVRSEGDASRGAKIYARTELSCVGCHKVGDRGGPFGPDLTAVGAGLPVERIIEAVLWPDRQVKEGFLATTLTLDDGQVVSGYLQEESGNRMVMRDIATGELRTLARNRIGKREDAGTVMPAGLTAGLSRQELADLIRYLSELR